MIGVFTFVCCINRIRLDIQFKAKMVEKMKVLVVDSTEFIKALVHLTV